MPLSAVITRRFVERRNTDFYECSGWYERTDARNLSVCDAGRRWNAQTRATSHYERKELLPLPPRPLSSIRAATTRHRFVHKH